MQNYFLLGNPRSGTSLLRIMLNNHPAIVAPPESGFMQWWYGKYKDWCVDDVHGSGRLADFVIDVLSSKKIETWNLDEKELESFLKKNKPANYAALTTLIYLFWSGKKAQSCNAIVDKNNYYIKYLNELTHWWPEAKFIFLVRDGRDVACSYLDMQKLESTSPYKPKLPFQIEEIAKEWVDNNLNIHQFLSSFSNEKWILVKYEDLISDTVAVLKRICAFIGVSFSEQMLTYYQTNDEPSSTIEWKKKTLEKPDVNNIGKYAKQLTAEQIDIFNFVASAGLSLLNYDMNRK